jgi:hypothetical protein
LAKPLSTILETSDSGLSRSPKILALLGQVAMQAGNLPSRNLGAQYEFEFKLRHDAADEYG